MMKKSDMPHVSVFTPCYLKPVDMKRCRASVHESGRGVGFHQCLRDKKLLEHDGMLFCKQHHPPSIQARDEKSRKCTYKRFGGACGAKLKIYEVGPWCLRCRARHAEDVRAEKVRAYNRVEALLAAIDNPKLPLTKSLIKAVKLRGLPKNPYAIMSTTARPGSPHSPSSASRPA